MTWISGLNLLGFAQMFYMGTKTVAETLSGFVALGAADSTLVIMGSAAVAGGAILTGGFTIAGVGMIAYSLVSYFM